MKKVIKNLGLLSILAGFLYLTSCTEEVKPLAPLVQLQELDTAQVTIKGILSTDGEEGDTTGGPRTGN